MLSRRMFDSTSSTYTYLLASRAGGEALIIDPVKEQLEQYLTVIQQLDLRLVHAIDTHTHADHITAPGDLRDATHCTTVMGELSKAHRVNRHVQEAEVLKVDNIELRAIYTAGHADESFSFELKLDAPRAVFTGDVLLARGSGGTDFQDGDPRRSHGSIVNKLFRLPDATTFYPAHDYKGWMASSIGEEKHFNPRLAGKTEAEYVERATSAESENDGRGHSCEPRMRAAVNAAEAAGIAHMMSASGAVMQGIAAAPCGGFVSFWLGLGGGGAILAVPLILYVVGLHNPHIAIGTAALAVAASAYINMISHARAGHVRWESAFAFVASGVVGAALSSIVGKPVDGQKLVIYFAFLDVLYGVPDAAARAKIRFRRRAIFEYLSASLRHRSRRGQPFGVSWHWWRISRRARTDVRARLPIVDAIGTSLFAVGPFGLRTAVNYSISGQVDWLITAEFVGGGVVGGRLGTRAASRLAKKRGAFNLVFSAMILSFAAYMLYHSWQAR